MINLPNELPEQILNFFHLSNSRKITKEKIIYNFENYHYPNICILARKIKRMIGEHHFEFVEVYNHLLFESFECIKTYLTTDRFRKINFDSFFWTHLKLQTLNYFNKINNKQFRFERNLAHKQYTNNFIRNLHQELNKENVQSNMESFLELQNRLKSQLNKTEQEILNNFLVSKQWSFITTQRRNKMLESIQEKILF
ncbi:hypothetical protein [Mycoplasma hafezii]|uniref:hypothetical protein n=1 Tax=Mycoplasma hafezii TaxID=525886 RepID=UPI003CF57F91